MKTKSELPNRRLRDIMIKFQHDIAINDIQILNKYNEKNKLSMNSIMYLDIIGGRNGEYTASSLAETLHIARPSVTQKLNELEKLGYIYKKQDEHDKRIYHIFRVVENNVLNEVFKKSDLEMEDLLVSNFSTEDINKFYDIIQFMGNHYEKIKIE